MTRFATIFTTLFFGLPATAPSLELHFPVACTLGQDCVVQNFTDQDPSNGARDYACGTLSYDGHNGTDIRLRSLAQQKKGVDVLAAASGRVLRSRDGASDVSVRTTGRTAVEGKECGNGIVIAHDDGFETQYCHLAKGSIRVRPGAIVATGDTIGRIGLSGNTEYPHLHITVRRHGKIVDPFGFEAPQGVCSAGTSLWAEPLRPLLAYKASAVLNTGFAPGPVTMEEIEKGDAGSAAVAAKAPALVVFARAIGLKKGDVQRLKLTAPDGNTIVENAAAPLDRDKAQAMVFAGKKTPGGGWQPGTYSATYEVDRGGATALKQTFTGTVAP